MQARFEGSRLENFIYLIEVRSYCLVRPTTISSIYFFPHSTSNKTKSLAEYNSFHYEIQPLYNSLFLFNKNICAELKESFNQLWAE